MIAFLFAAALIAAASGQAATPQPVIAAKPAAAQVDAFMVQEIAYAQASLAAPGWALLSATHDLVIYYKGLPSTPMPKLWIRGEHYPLGPDNPIGTGESFVTTYDVDCSGNRSRTLSSTVYSGAKMQGSIVAASDKAGEWMPLKPGGFTAMGAEEVCAKSAAAPAAKSASATPRP